MTSITGGNRWPLIAAVVLGLAIVAWALMATAGNSGSDEGVHRSGSSEASPSPPASAAEPSAPPTVMPDGAPIPTPSPGVPSVIGEGKTEIVAPVSVMSPIELDEIGDFGTGLVVELAQMESVEGVARAPGEIAGPALAVTVRVVNEASEPVSLDGVVVFLAYGEDLVPATVFGQGSAPLRGDLAPGSATTGTYVFAVPEEQRQDVRIEISYTGEAPTVVFAGATT